MKFHKIIAASLLACVLLSESRGADDETNGLDEFLLLPDNRRLVQENRPENLTVCSHASLSSYGNEDDDSNEARRVLEIKGFHKVKEDEKGDLSLHAEAWENQDTNNLIVAFRGPVFTPETLPSIFLNKAIAHYAASCNVVASIFSKGVLGGYIGSEEPPAYLTRHIQACRDHWVKENLISPDESIGCFAPYLPGTKFSQALKTSGSFMAGYGLVTSGMIVAGVALTPVGASLVAGGTAYAVNETIGGQRLERQSIHHLVSVHTAALELAEKYIDNRNVNVIYTGHSLGGFIANTVAELSSIAPSSSIIFNAPGGAQKFIEEQKNSILGGEDGWGTWVGKTVLYYNKKFDHTPRNITVNISRSHDMVGRAGGDDACRKSLLVDDYKVNPATDIASYFYENHSMANLVRDLGHF